MGFPPCCSRGPRRSPKSETVAPFTSALRAYGCGHAAFTRRGRRRGSGEQQGGNRGGMGEASHTGSENMKSLCLPGGCDLCPEADDFVTEFAAPGERGVREIRS